LDRTLQPGTTDYALRLAWTATLIAVLVPPVAVMAFAFAAIAIWRGELGAGLVVVIAALLTSLLGSVIWTIVLS
jgi:hypothetical protein